MFYGQVESGLEKVKCAWKRIRILTYASTVKAIYIYIYIYISSHLFKHMLQFIHTFIFILLFLLNYKQYGKTNFNLK